MVCFLNDLFMIFIFIYYYSSLASFAAHANPFVLKVILRQRQAVFMQFDGILVHVPYHKSASAVDLFMEGKVYSIHEMGLTLTTFGNSILAVGPQEFSDIMDFLQAKKTSNHISLYCKCWCVLHILAAK